MNEYRSVKMDKIGNLVLGARKEVRHIITADFVRGRGRDYPSVSCCFSLAGKTITFWTSCLRMLDAVMAICSENVSSISAAR